MLKKYIWLITILSLSINYMSAKNLPIVKFAIKNGLSGLQEGQLFIQECRKVVLATRNGRLDKFPELKNRLTYIINSNPLYIKPSILELIEWNEEVEDLSRWMKNLPKDGFDTEEIEIIESIRNVLKIINKSYLKPVGLNKCIYYLKNYKYKVLATVGLSAIALTVLLLSNNNSEDTMNEESHSNESVVEGEIVYEPSDTDSQQSAVVIFDNEPQEFVFPTPEVIGFNYVPNCTQIHWEK